MFSGASWELRGRGEAAYLGSTLRRADAASSSASRARGTCRGWCIAPVKASMGASAVGSQTHTAAGALGLRKPNYPLYRREN